MFPPCFGTTLQASSLFVACAFFLMALSLLRVKGTRASFLCCAVVVMRAAAAEILVEGEKVIGGCRILEDRLSMLLAFMLCYSLAIVCKFRFLSVKDKRLNRVGGSVRGFVSFAQ